MFYLCRDLCTTLDCFYLRLGFSGEFAPRTIIRSEVRCKETGKIRKLFDYENVQDLYDLLVEFIHLLYFK